MTQNRHTNYHNNTNYSYMNQPPQNIQQTRYVYSYPNQQQYVPHSQPMRNTTYIYQQHHMMQLQHAANQHHHYNHSNYYHQHNQSNQSNQYNNYVNPHYNQQYNQQYHQQFNWELNQQRLAAYNYNINKLQNLKLNDFVDINIKKEGWKHGKIIDIKDGYVTVMYHSINSKQIHFFKTRWNSIDQIAPFLWICKKNKLSLNLICWKRLAHNNIDAVIGEIPVVKPFVMNSNEIICIYPSMICKYYTYLDKWECSAIDLDIMDEDDNLGHFACCCLNDDKSKLYLLNTNPYLSYIKEIDLKTMQYEQYETSTHLVSASCMIMVDNSLHIIGNDKHYIWNDIYQHFEMIHKLHIELERKDTEIIYIESNNTLLLLPYLCQYSLAEHKWRPHPLYNAIPNKLSCYSWILTLNAKYLIIFSTNKGKDTYLLNLKDSVTTEINTNFSDIFSTQNHISMVVNNTSFLIEGFIWESWNSLFCSKMKRTLSLDVILMIQAYYGYYENDEIYIFGSSKQWKIKVSDIVLHDCPNYLYRKMEEINIV